MYIENVLQHLVPRRLVWFKEAVTAVTQHVIADVMFFGDKCLDKLAD